MPQTPQETLEATAAAEATAHLTLDLLRFAREGEQPDGLAFDLDTITLAADAARKVVGLERPRLAAKADDPEGLELLDDLHAALTRFLEGWA